MKKNILKLATAAALVGTLSGCVGTNAVTGYVMKFNLMAVDNRYARGGLNMLLAPVYGFSMAADVFVFNSIEFWTGQNIINKKPHIFDSKVSTLLDINGSLDPSLQKAPIGPLTNVSSEEKEVYSMQINTVNENTLDFNIVYSNGETAVLRGEKEGEMIQFYMDGDFVTTVSLTELEEYAATKA